MSGIDVGILGRRGHRIVARPAITEVTEDVVSKEGGGQVAVKERLLHTGVDVELMGIVTESVIVAGGIMQIEHGLGGLVDGEPVAEVYLPFGLIEFRVETVCLRVEILLKITEGQRGTIESELWRGRQ